MWSEFPILSVAQPFANHNGGDLNFGPDGYLYISLGDGGGGGDPDENGQDGMALLGKILRIDVHSGSPYAIPGDNPFVSDPGTLDEIWALGLRNPWRFSFDRSTGDMWIADVGQGTWEEIDFQPAASGGGENYGWDCYEGNHSFEPAGCGPIGDFTFPVHEYNHSPDNCSVTGGFVYRGSAFPAMTGHYFFGDYCSGRFWSLVSDGGGGFDLEEHGQHAINFSSFGEDAAGEIYAADLGGTVYRVEANSSPPGSCPAQPAGGCTSPGKSVLVLKSAGDPARNKLTWKWLKGPQLDQIDFGNPASAATSYTLCLYGGTASAIIDIGLPDGTSWATVSDKGYRYDDQSGSNQGVFKVLEKGGEAGKSKILVKAKGSNLDLPTLALGEPTSVTVQLLRSDDPGCFESVFSFPFTKDSDTVFKAKN